MNDLTVNVSKVVDAPNAKVFDAWLNPESVTKWMCPGETVVVPDPKIDAQVGGKFDFTMKVGDQVLPHGGEYKIIDRPQKLQFTWVSAGTNNFDSVVTISFESMGDKETKVILHHAFLPTEESKMDHTGGWTRIVDCLAKELAR